MSNSSKAAKQLSAKRIRTRNNVIVYIVLSILAFIWLFRGLDHHDQLPR